MGTPKGDFEKVDMKTIGPDANAASKTGKRSRTIRYQAKPTK
jgi:hypothetical protein